MQKAQYLEWQLALEKKKTENSYRELKLSEGLIDFTSNDYLGLSRNAELHKIISLAYDNINIPNKLGSTGSRLISGNNYYFENLETQLSKVHKSETALLFNNGYMANQAIFSTLPQKGDTLIYDELCHACIKEGARLSFANRYSFFHNDINNLETKLKNAKGKIYVAVESVYSMDGDFAPLKEISILCNKYSALLIVDEAHSTGVYGPDGAGLVCELGLEDSIPIRIHTFGKAMGCHGAAVVGQQILKNYLINFARPFIFTTAMSLHSAVTISEAYNYLAQNSELQLIIKNKISQLNQLLNKTGKTIKSDSPIHALIIPGNNQVKEIASRLQHRGFDIRPILSPTVKKGTERLRICLHNFNSDQQILEMVSELNRFYY